MAEFKIHSDYQPTGDQPQAIAALTEGVKKGFKHQVLLGVTGSGKTFTMANIIKNLGRPALVIAHNKTLAAQLAGEFREFFPENAVGYFVSYYDYYQPEAYIPSTDTFIEKDSSVNDEIDRMRHSATAWLAERRDVVIVASVSCIYGLGDPEEYESLSVSLREGMVIDRDELLRRLVEIQYERNDFEQERGSFRVRGDVVEIIPAASNEKALRIELFGDEIERIAEVEIVSGHVLRYLAHVMIFPASHYATSRDKLERCIENIENDLSDRLNEFKAEGKLLEAQRLEQRTRYDIEMLREIGYCTGIENYSRYFDGRAPGALMPSSRQPPPLKTIPRSATSAASSGGVFSRTAQTASAISLVVGCNASRISADVSVMVFGSPVITFRPFTSMLFSSILGYAEPI